MCRISGKAVNNNYYDKLGRDGAGVYSQCVYVVTTSSPAPVRYNFTKTTTYVDENGNPVSVETVKSGAPVTVYYSGDGDNRGRGQSRGEKERRCEPGRFDDTPNDDDHVIAGHGQFVQP